MRPRRLRDNDHGSPRTPGFSLVELTIVVLILAILAAVVLPKFVDGRKQAEYAQAATIMKTFAEAVRRYHLDHGDYPPDPSHGVFPPELGPYLQTLDMQTTPLGGLWDYENWTGPSSAPFRIAISIRNGDTARYADVDALLDDGDLTTGGVQRVNRSGARLQFGIVRR